MIHRADVRLDDVVLVTGASGGVGSAAVQLARRRGADVIAIASADKQDAIRALGAVQVLGRDDDLVAALAGRRVDVVIDVVGGPQWPTLLDVLRPGGRYAVAGAIAGPMVPLDLRTLYLKDLRLIGCTVLDQEVFPNLVGYIERGEIQPLVAATFPLSEIVAAQQLFLTKQHVGKIVLRCD
jgi:NADPH:quinone reductase-like Zn-dependent oxidoreductase